MKTYVVQWLPEADDGIDDFTHYVARDSSWAYALRLTKRITREVNKAARRAPCLLSSAGMGRKRAAHALAVMGGHEEPRSVR